jgi:hypothetical protein
LVILQFSAQLLPTVAVAVELRTRLHLPTAVLAVVVVVMVTQLVHRLRKEILAGQLAMVMAVVTVVTHYSQLAVAVEREV